MMGSSKVEIASSSSPFKCVLKDHNNREKHREPNSNQAQKSQRNFENNLKVLVKNHLPSCISISARGSNIEEAEAQENSPIKFPSFGCLGASHDDSHTNISWKGTNIKKFTTNIGGNDMDNDNGGTSSPKRKRKSQILERGDDVRVQTQPMPIAFEMEQQRSLSKCHSVSSRTSSSMRDPSPTPSDCSSSDLSVSSLVQKWRGLEAEAMHHKCNYNKNNNNNNNNIGHIYIHEHNKSCSSNKTNRINSDMLTLETTIIKSGDNIQDHMMNSMKPSQCTSHHQKDQRRRQQQQHEHEHDRVSSKGEKDGISVADMVRAWANTNHVSGECDEIFQEQQPSFGECLARLRNIKDNRVQRLKSFPVVSSPKLRGRQAIVDLFIKMKKERYNEISSLASFHLVTKFPLRGRIQSILRLKHLRQEASMQKQCRSPSMPKPGEPNQSQTTSSNNNNLRDRLCMTTNEDTGSMRKTYNDTSANYMKFSHIHTSTKIQESQNKSTCGEFQQQANCHNENNVKNPIANNMGNKQVEQILLTSNQVFEESSNMYHEKIRIPSKLPEARVEQLIKCSTINIREDFPHGSSNDQRQVTSYKGDVDVSNMQDGTSMSMMCTNSDEVEEIVNEHQLENKQRFGISLDWTVDIARPRAYWEDQRKAWYNHIINTTSTNEDIRQLIKRGYVSSLLASDFRERMDRIMLKNIQRMMHISINEGEEGHQSMKTFLEKHQENEQEHTSRTDQYGAEDEERNDETNEYIEMTSHLQQYQDVSDYERTPSPSRSNEDETSEVDSDKIASTSLKQPSLDHSYYGHHNDGSSFKNVSSIEVELIYDLRTHMQQLYQELFELRKSITSCVDMQVKLQNSIKEEVSAAINQIDEEKSNSNGRQSKQGFCCICYEKKIDSLLYRCGHICTCFSCANELHWSSGKCPICRAQIVDVVRTYRDK